MRLIATALFLMAAAMNAQAETKPNIVWIVADDLGHGDVGFTGLNDFATPHIDAIAADGVVCTNAYCPHPFCGPSRAALMAGRYQQRFGFYGNPLPKSRPNYDPKFGLPPSETTIAERLSSAGYRTGIVGKWHLGAEPEFHPLTNGFTDFFGFLEGHRRYYATDIRWQSKPDDDSIESHAPQAGSRKNYLTDLLSDEACHYITETDSQQPLFLYLAYNAPHTPMQATQPWLDKVDDIDDPLRRVYAAMVTAMDDGIGKVVQALRQSGRYENTLIFFTSDNGGIPPVNGARNRPFRGMKGNLLEGGIRVPTAISWPARLKPGRTFAPPIIAFDIYATSLAAAGIAMPDESDSVDLLPHLSAQKLHSEPMAPPHEALFWKTGGSGQMAVRSGDQKLLSVRSLPDRVFDLSTDMKEREPSHNPEDQDRLQQLAGRWNATLPDHSYDGPPATKWPEQARALGLTPSAESVRSRKQRDLAKRSLLRKALPPNPNPDP